MPAFLAAGSLALGAYGASREKKRQERLRALAAQQKGEARRRGEENIARYRGEMASPMRMARLALGTTGRHAALRTTGLEADQRQRKLKEREMRDQLGGPASASALSSTDDSAFTRFLQTEGHITQSQAGAQAKYTGLKSEVATKTSQMQQGYDAEQTALGSANLQMQASQADAYGAFASGVGASMGSMAGTGMQTTETDAAGNKITTQTDVGQELADSYKMLKNLFG